MGERSLLPDYDELGMSLMDEKKKRVDSTTGKFKRKLKHNPEIYHIWFVANSVLNEHGYLPEKIAKDWKLKSYKLPEGWKDREDVIDVCEKFLDKEGYRLFGEKIGAKPSVIVKKEQLRFEPQEEILIQVPLDTSKTLQQRVDEIHKLLKRVHVFTKDQEKYKELEGCDWNLKNKRITSKYQTTLKKPRAGYFWELVLFLKYYLEQAIQTQEKRKKKTQLGFKKGNRTNMKVDPTKVTAEGGYKVEWEVITLDKPKILWTPQDFKRKLRGLEFMREYFAENEEKYWKMPYMNRVTERGKSKISRIKRDADRYREKFMSRFRDDAILLYKALVKGKFPVDRK